jgi:hypothetical protein
MGDSILDSTKKILGISDDYTAFDMDIITHINSVFSVIHQLGVGPDNTFSISDDSEEWTDLNLPVDQMNLLRSYLYLKVRMLFDPTDSRFLIGAIKEQLDEFEHRLSYMREATIPIPVPTEDSMETEEVEDWERLFVNTWGEAGSSHG